MHGQFLGMIYHNFPLADFIDNNVVMFQMGA